MSNCIQPRAWFVCGIASPHLDTFPLFLAREFSTIFGGQEPQFDSEGLITQLSINYDILDVYLERHSNKLYTKDIMKKSKEFFQPLRIFPFSFRFL